MAKQLSLRDWGDIQDAISNSDLPNERRIALLDGWASFHPNYGKTNSRTWGAVVPR